MQKRADYIAANFREKLIDREVGLRDRKKRAPTSFWDQEIERERNGERSTPLDEAVSNRVNAIIGYDPTPHKGYSIWLTRQWVAKGIRQENDFPKVRAWLERFDKLKTSGYFKRNPDDAALADINRMSVKDLATFLEKIPSEAELSNAEKERVLEQDFYTTKQAICLLDDDDTRVVQVKSHAASCHFGRNTRWCTAARDDEDAFDSYDECGKLFIVLHKPTNRRWQFHLDDYDGVEALDELDEAFADWDNPALVKFAKLAWRKKKWRAAVVPDGMRISAAPPTPTGLLRALNELEDELDEEHGPAIRQKLSEIEVITTTLVENLIDDFPNLLLENAERMSERAKATYEVLSYVVQRPAPALAPKRETLLDKLRIGQLGKLFW